MTVAVYLSLARQAHAQYRASAGAVDKNGRILRLKDHAACRAAILDAITARGHATALDSDERDPAWAEDRALNKGQTNAQMLAFYDKQLMKSMSNQQPGGQA